MEAKVKRAKEKCCRKWRPKNENCNENKIEESREGNVKALSKEQKK
jgi:hypothetical protein